MLDALLMIFAAFLIFMYLAYVQRNSKEKRHELIKNGKKTEGTVIRVAYAPKSGGLYYSFVDSHGNYNWILQSRRCTPSFKIGRAHV